MIYLDNAATSYPKPKSVLEAVQKCLREQGGSPGRGAHRLSLEASRIIFETRELLAGFLGISNSADLIFTCNATHAINLAFKGLLQPGDHVVTTSIEHNAVARPLQKLAEEGVKVTKVPCSLEGFLSLDDLEGSIQPRTKLIVTTHASNVLGTIIPVAEIGRIAKKHNLIFMVDAAQTIGSLPIDVGALGVDLLAFSGHKGLLGLQGTGGLYVNPDIKLEELVQGGTGSRSESLEQPQERPDRYESGTANTPGLAGLGAAVKFLIETGLENIRGYEESLTTSLMEGVGQIPGVRIYGPSSAKDRISVVSINIDNIDASQVAFMLDQLYGIAVRSGLHCAPEAHRTMGTLEKGAVRFSPGYFNTEKDIKAAVSATQAIAKESIKMV